MKNFINKEELKYKLREHYNVVLKQPISDSDKLVKHDTLSEVMTIINEQPSYGDDIIPSKKFDMDISFEELIDYNKTCKVDVKSRRHFESYEGILIYVSHPNNKEKFSIQLGICEDGIIYEGDYGCLETYKEIPIQQGLELLMKYGRLLNMRHELQCILLKNDIEPDRVFVDIK